MTMLKTERLDVGEIRERARYRWQSTILPALGIGVPPGPMRHGPCPACGGKDRFRFDNKNGYGTFFCNQCNPKAGDGFALIQNVKDCGFREALALVADVLGVTICGRPAPDPRALSEARRRRMAEQQQRDLQDYVVGLSADAARVAERLIMSARNIDISGWTDDQLGMMLNDLGDAYEILESESTHVRA